MFSSSSMLYYVSHFILSFLIPFYEYTTFFIHSFIGACLDYFHQVAIVNNIFYEHWCPRICLWACFQYFWEYTWERSFRVMAILWVTTSSFPLQLHNFTWWWMKFQLASPCTEIVSRKWIRQKTDTIIHMSV
jgi:hypothetical protein